MTTPPTTPSLAVPLWKQLAKQDDLEAQYDVLLRRQVMNVYTNKEVAIFLARFAEARIFAPADRHVDAVETKLKESEAERQRLTARSDQLAVLLTVEQAQVAELARLNGELLAMIDDLLHLTYLADHAWDDSDYALRDRIQERRDEIETERATAPSAAATGRGMPTIPPAIAMQMRVLMDYAEMTAAPNGAMQAVRKVAAWLDTLEQRPSAQEGRRRMTTEPERVIHSGDEQPTVAIATAYLPIILAALTEYEHARAAFWDGLPQAMADAAECRAAMAAIRATKANIL